MSPSQVKRTSKKVEETEWNSRGWIPLKYPESALSREEESFVYFPFHKDVILACVRELLILDGTLDSDTLKTSKNESKFKGNGEIATTTTTTVPRYCKHLDPESWPRSAEQDDNTAALERKRKKSKTNGGSNKRIKVGGMTTSSHQMAVTTTEPHLQSSEEIANAIIERGKIGVSSSRPPRKVSEADNYHSNHHQNNNKDGGGDDDDGDEEKHKLATKKVLDLNNSQEISTILSLEKRNSNGCFSRQSNTLSSIIHLSISSEAFLRDVALSMTEKMVDSFSDKALRLFMGYKAPSIRRERLTQLVAGFLFDTSHAMFAWDQTEQEVLARDPKTKNLDSIVQNCLFDDRALKKIGGFDDSSLLPHAISIARHRRRNVSWESFACTVQGKRMLEHHGRDKSIILAGKQRRGQRLRQRHWLTSSLLCQESIKDTPNLSETKSYSFVSSEEDNDDELDSPRVHVDENPRQVRVLADMPGTKAVMLVKKSPQTSWGVCLGKEGNVCVVGRAAEQDVGDKEDNRLQCGDLILYGRNEHGQEASSPLCAWTGDQPSTEEDWFPALVDLFKTSQELHLVVQRVT